MEGLVVAIRKVFSFLQLGLFWLKFNVLLHAKSTGSRLIGNRVDARAIEDNLAQHQPNLHLRRRGAKDTITRPLLQGFKVSLERVVPDTAWTFL